jgi:hypothetical protein
MQTNVLKHLLAGVTSLIMASLGHPAYAQGSITGTIEFDGGALLNGTIGSATAFDSFYGPLDNNPVVLQYSQSGDYASVPDGTPAAFTTFTFNGPQATPFQLWTFAIGSTTYGFTINSIDYVTQNSNFLDIMGSGTAQITGYYDTPGTWTITDTSANPNSVRVTFSSSITAVPEPTSAGCLLLGLGVLVWFQRLKTGRQI